MTSDTSHKVFLIGAGPGAADLITVRGARLLALADAVLYDALVTPEMLELCPQAEKINVGKRCGQKSATQLFINRMLVNTAKKYPLVVRLKGGDPMLFGRADEELSALDAAGIAYEVVPGITAALAAASAVGLPLTKRGVSRSVAFFTSSMAAEEPETALPRTAEQASRAVGGQGARSAGTGLYSNVHEDSEHRATQPSDRAAACSGVGLPDCDTLVQYMGGREAKLTAERLLAQGRDPQTPVVVIENVSLPTQRIHRTDLHALKEGLPPASGPVLVMVGEALTARNTTMPVSQALQHDTGAAQEPVAKYR